MISHYQTELFWVDFYWRNPSHEVEVTGEPKISNDDDCFLPDVDLTGLSEDQRQLATTMLKWECHSFARNDDEVGCIKDLQIGITLTTSEPVQKKYISVPRPLYVEVKQYIEDLLNKEFIKESLTRGVYMFMGHLGCV